MADERGIDHGQDRRRRIFYYDADCGFCTWTVRWLARVDLFGQIAWVSFQSLGQPPRGLSWDDLDNAAYLDDTGRGELHGGFYAFRLLTIRLPLLFPLAPLFWCPGVRYLGVPVYGWVARNRYRISACRVTRRK
jgi:predicted DCC family thiol-disulfide oxidoreductase YuxK